MFYLFIFVGGSKGVSKEEPTSEDFECVKNGELEILRCETEPKEIYSDGREFDLPLYGVVEIKGHRFTRAKEKV